MQADAAAGLLGPATPWAAARPPHPVTAPGPVAGQRIRLATYSDRAELPEIAAAGYRVAALDLRGFGASDAPLKDDQLSKDGATLRGLFELKTAERQPVPIDEVEPASEIVKRFVTGAMSY